LILLDIFIQKKLKLILGGVIELEQDQEMFDGELIILW
jgi:hypothetical protein